MRRTSDIPMRHPFRKRRSSLPMKRKGTAMNAFGHGLKDTIDALAKLHPAPGAPTVMCISINNCFPVCYT